MSEPAEWEKRAMTEEQEGEDAALVEVQRPTLCCDSSSAAGASV
jgi:hypothetical protein